MLRRCQGEGCLECQVVVLLSVASGLATLTAARVFECRSSLRPSRAQLGHFLGNGTNVDG
jgi:hypothetical protein